ncbi:MULTISPECIES: MarR family winged helix-turn-helix transcriptional regulator [Pseudomonas aeruginosa group]|uniref:Bacterial regulatory, arsR family protein n=1 Tax=Pseudomonas paraeruginosa TaxID=2994495 RepID=A0A2R3IXF8_9PSED|nr:MULTISPECIES: MarR family winged helix-turn-helix transcriptional regulator [Pseudomonas aeruginosa group]VTS17890.1 transcription regulator, MarR family [Streptococcus dysgalactiae subsp. equisimilis]AVK06608.1 bacterial regulatory, arsR family protein [Pseudomonas paraeruginosa]AVR69179.1 MarR family transcriptional regulator [Pseudomonas paraeruginosa]AWE94950.1 bacterial regulatory, arsR family protein [Pseudomonas paraeruginosa]KAB0748149.1 winged helix-turn-helix transcriptional regul
MSALALYDYLERLTSLMRAWSREQPLVAELQPVQLSALHYLARCNRYSDTPLVVTEYLGLTKGTVSQSLKVLEGKGLISKVPDARDRRSVHLRLTEAGRSLIDAVIPPRFLEQAVAALGEKGERLQGLLHELLVVIQREEDVPGFGLCRSCRFHEQRDGAPFCGLTRESLSQADGELICREHQACA